MTYHNSCFPPQCGLETICHTAWVNSNGFQMGRKFGKCKTQTAAFRTRIRQHWFFCVRRREICVEICIFHLFLQNGNKNNTKRQKYKKIKRQKDKKIKKTKRQKDKVEISHHPVIKKTVIFNELWLILGLITTDNLSLHALHVQE